jgi:hypothetical protein
MKKLSLLVAVVISCLGAVAPTAVFAADPVFTFAPPPVSYEGSAGSQRFTYVSADFGTDTMTGFGYNQSTKEDASLAAADGKEKSFGAFLLTSDVITMLAIDGGWKSEYHSDSSDLVSFHSLNFGVQMINIDLGGADYVDVMSLPLTLTGGIQNKFAVGDNTIVTPYVYGLVTMVPSTSTASIGSTTTTTSDSFTSTGVVFGFDVFFSGISLSAMLTSSDNDMLMVSVGIPLK